PVPRRFTGVIVIVVGSRQARQDALRKTLAAAQHFQSILLCSIVDPRAKAAKTIIEAAQALEDRLRSEEQLLEPLTVRFPPAEIAAAKYLTRRCDVTAEVIGPGAVVGKV